MCKSNNEDAIQQKLINRYRHTNTATLDNGPYGGQREKSDQYSTEIDQRVHVPTRSKREERDVMSRARSIMGQRACSRIMRCADKCVYADVSKSPNERDVLIGVFMQTSANLIKERV